MARERMVTRSINVATYTAICVDMAGANGVSTSEYKFTLTGEVLDGAKALNALKKEHETDTFKIVAITDRTIEEKMFGMREIDFLKVAEELDPETRKRLF